MSMYLFPLTLWPTSAIAALALALTACAPLSPATGHANATNTVRRADGPLSVPASLVALTEPIGQKRLMSTRDNQSYWPLSEYFETQRNEAYCAVASSVMALNALGIDRPASSQYPDFPYFTQDDFFGVVNPHIANAARVSMEGMTLDQLSAALSAFPVNIEAHHAGDLTLAQYRDLIRETTSHGDRFALVNFLRSEIGEVGGGHWSPVAAFDVASDSALVLDVARYKYPAVWVPVAKLYAGSQAKDSVSGISRGIVVVSKR